MSAPQPHRTLPLRIVEPPDLPSWNGVRPGRQGGPCESVLEAVGGTPLVRATGFLAPSNVALYLKLESANPGGSMKDRPATRMVEQAIRTGRLRPGAVVVESSSGNTGVGLAQVCRFYGLRFICVVDRHIPLEAVRIMEALGARVEMVEDPIDGSGQLLSARLERVARLLSEIRDSFWPNQYANEENPRAHETGTMAEIDEALDGQVDTVFVPVGSTGTLHGCVDFVRRFRRATRVVAVDAAGSVLFGGCPGPRQIPGMGAGVLPPLAADRPVPELIRVSDLECVVGCRRLALTDALLVGGSAGGALQALRKRQSELTGRTCVVIAPDSGRRYLDTVYDDGWVEERLGCPPWRLRELVGPVRVERL
jgi:N-(2-amino-2-carboxyethyl)-L-glutamate synthase